MVAPNVGARRARVPASHLEAPIDLMALYPSAADESPLRVGPYTIDVAIDAAALPGPWPVVLLSHGSGGSPMTHRDLARHLARAGFLVLLPTHPGNNRDDNHLAGTADILVQRPRDVSAVLDWVESSEGFPGQAEDPAHRNRRTFARGLHGPRARARPAAHDSQGHTRRPAAPDPGRRRRSRRCARPARPGRAVVHRRGLARRRVRPDPDADRRARHDDGQSRRLHRGAPPRGHAPGAPDRPRGRPLLVSGPVPARNGEPGVPAVAGSAGLRSRGIPRHALSGS